jgi:hypothetical protein
MKYYLIGFGLLVLGGILGFFLKPGSSPVPSSRAVTLERPPVSFTLPAGYSAYQSEGFEGGYASYIAIGKEFGAGYLRQAPVSIRVASEIQNDKGKSYTPEEYEAMIFSQATERGGKPEHTTLFGNPAVRYSSEADGAPTVVGSITAKQHRLPSYGDLLVIVSGDTYGSGMTPDALLFEQVLSSLTLAS